MTIIFRCLEGVHGVGKTSWINRIKKCTNFPVIEENFLDFKLPDQRATTNVINELATIVAWFERIFKIVEANPEWELDTQEHFIYVDRSMLSPIAYMGSITSCGDDRETHRSASFLLHAVRSILIQACSNYNIMFHIVAFEPAEGAKQLLSQIRGRANSLDDRERTLRIAVLKEDNLDHIRHVTRVLEHAYFLLVNWGVVEPALRERIFVSTFTVNPENKGMLSGLSDVRATVAFHKGLSDACPKYRVPSGRDVNNFYGRYQFKDEIYISALKQHCPELADSLSERLTGIVEIESENDLMDSDSEWE